MRIFILGKFKFARKDSFKTKANKQTGPYGSWGAAPVPLDSKFHFSKVMLFTLSLRISL